MSCKRVATSMYTLKRIDGTDNDLRERERERERDGDLFGFSAAISAD